MLVLEWPDGYEIGELTLGTLVRVLVSAVLYKMDCWLKACILSSLKIFLGYSNLKKKNKFTFSSYSHVDFFL